MVALAHSKKILSALFSLLIVSNLSAAGLMFHNRIQSSGPTTVTIGQPSAEAYVEIYGIGCSYKTKNINNIITFGIDHENLTYFSSDDVFSVVITVDRANLPDTTLTLTVQNKPSSPDNFYIDKQTYLFNNQDNFTVTIDTI